MASRAFLYKNHLQNRKLLRKFLKNISPEQANIIPPNCSNNIIWNCAHVISVQQSLAYYLFGFPMRMDKNFVKQYTNGTKPESNVDETFIESICEQLLTTSDWMREDIGEASPDIRAPFPTMINLELSNMDETLAFINYHEGVHTGVITGLLKWVK